MEIVNAFVIGGKTQMIIFKDIIDMFLNPHWVIFSYYFNDFLNMLVKIGLFIALISFAMGKTKKRKRR